MVGAEDLLKGTVKWFDVRRGFGIILPEDGGENVFVHQSSIRAVGHRSLDVGEAVEFVVSLGDDGRRRAVNVTGPGGAYIKGRRYFGGACYHCGEVGHLARECPGTGIEPASSRSDLVKPLKLGSILSFSSSASLPSDYAKEEIPTGLDMIFESVDSQEEEEEEEEEEDDDDDREFPRGLEQRNWAELPRDVLSVIFKKIAAVEIIRSAQFVCRPWRHLSHEPELWRHIYLKKPDYENMDMADFKSLGMLAVDRSKGCLEKFHFESFARKNDEITSHIADKSISHFILLFMFFVGFKLYASRSPFESFVPLKFRS